jgi:hypothetical protein
MTVEHDLFRQLERLKQRLRRTVRSAQRENELAYLMEVY